MVSKVPALHQTIGGLVAGMSYRLEVEASNKFGPSEERAEVEFTFENQPDPVADLRISEYTYTGIAISWKTPAYTGGSQELTYHVKVSGPDGTTAIEESTTTRIYHVDIVPEWRGQEILFEVTSQSTFAESEP